MNNLVLAVVFFAVAIGAYADIRKREVPDWLNYGLVAFGLGANALQSLALWDFTPLLYSLVGAAVFFGVAYAMFYTGQWGGGDSKLLIGLGAALGLPFSLTFPFIDMSSFMVAFWLNLLLAGVLYALIWAAFAALRNRKKFVKEMKLLLKRQDSYRKFVIGISIALLIASIIAGEPFQKMMFAAVAVMLVLALYLSAFSRAVENSCMLSRVKPSKLTEGDWIAKDVVVDKKVITGPRDLGVSKRQIRQLERLYRQKKLKTVLIKIGIPFVPSFFASLVLTALYGNLFVLLLSIFPA